MNLRERLGKEWLFCDGGSGTMLQDMGLVGGELPETWNVKYPDRVMSIHQGYFEAGCDIVNTNTFGLNALKFGDDVEKLCKAAVQIAKQARINAHREADSYIALDLGPTGKLLQPMGDLSFDDCVELYAQVIRVGANEGADLILIETMNDSMETKAAVLAAKENCDLPIFVTNVYNEQGVTMTGASIEAMVAMLEGLRVDAIGMNCGFGPHQMLPLGFSFCEL